MGKGLPKLTLVWIYEGDDLETRRNTITTLGYPDVEVITPDTTHPLDQMSELMSPDSEIVLFWADDGKPVGPDFLQQMVRPLIAQGDPPALMHLWSGNAVAMRRAGLESVQKGIFKLVGNSFMKLAIFFLEVGSEERGARAQVVVSSTEQLAPLCAEPVGRVC